MLTDARDTASIKPRGESASGLRVYWGVRLTGGCAILVFYRCTRVFIRVHLKQRRLGAEYQVVLFIGRQLHVGERQGVLGQGARAAGDRDGPTVNNAGLFPRVISLVQPAINVSIGGVKVKRQNVE